jgi:hypothetical protein
VLETPGRFGARNWLLYVDWKGDAVHCLRVRTADSMQERPRDAPADHCDLNRTGRYTE